MDNASKALIMAGAILIAVALVGVGVYLYQSASGMMNSGVDELIGADMLTKNAKIEMYEGTISGAELKTLIRSLEVYNRQKIFPTDLSVSGAPDVDEIRATATYKIGVGYDDAGWINSISCE